MTKGLVRIDHFTDPACPFAFSAEPDILALHWLYGEQLEWNTRLVELSEKKGERKKASPEVMLLEAHGIEGDAHAGPWHRQVSLLAQESIDKMIAAGLTVGPGDFAENITTRGIEVFTLPIGTVLDLGEALVQVTQIGKECHSHCAIYHQAGDCVMPREGIFVRVLRGGKVAPGDAVTVRAWGFGA